MRNSIIILLGLTCSLLTAGYCHAQPVVNLKPVDLNGKVISLTPNSITFRADDKKIYVADIRTVRTLNGGILDLGPPNVRVKGMVDATYIKRGDFIRFEAKLENERRVIDEVKEMTLFVRDDFTEFGLLPPDEGELPDLADAVKAAEEAEAAKKGDDARKRKSSKKGPSIQKFLVSGMVMSAKKRIMKIEIPTRRGSKEFTVKLAENALVNLDLDDLSLVKAGDAISATGSAARLPGFFAMDVEITLDRGFKKPLAAGLADDKAGKGAADGKAAGRDFGALAKKGDVADKMKDRKRKLSAKIFQVNDPFDVPLPAPKKKK